MKTLASIILAALAAVCLASGGFGFNNTDPPADQSWYYVQTFVDNVPTYSTSTVSGCAPGTVIVGLPTSNAWSSTSTVTETLGSLNIYDIGIKCNANTPWANYTTAPYGVCGQELDVTNIKQPIDMRVWIPPIARSGKTCTVIMTGATYCMSNQPEYCLTADPHYLTHGYPNSTLDYDKCECSVLKGGYAWEIDNNGWSSPGEGNLFPPQGPGESSDYTRVTITLIQSSDGWYRTTSAAPFSLNVSEMEAKAWCDTCAAVFTNHMLQVPVSGYIYVVLDSQFYPGEYDISQP